MAQKKKGGSGNRGIVMTIAVGAMAIVMVLTMMLPSLSLIFASSGQSSSSSASSDSTPTTVQEADEKYQPTVAALQEQLDADPNSLSALANLGYAYFDWATAVRGVISSIQSGDAALPDDEPADEAAESGEADAPEGADTAATPDAPASAEVAEVAASPSSPEDADEPSVTVDDEVHQEDLFRRAQGYFDRYLALEDSESISVSRILCEYYLGEEEQAIDALAGFCEEHDFGPGWANLGMMYATAGELDQARSAFESAQAADPDDEYGSKSYAESYLSYLDQIEQLTASIASGSEGVTTSVGADGTSVITLDGSSVDEDGNVVVPTSDVATGSSGSTAVSATSSAPTTSLKDTVGGLF